MSFLTLHVTLQEFQDLQLAGLSAIFDNGQAMKDCLLGFLPRRLVKMLAKENVEGRPATIRVHDMRLPKSRLTWDESKKGDWTLVDRRMEGKK